MFPLHNNITLGSGWKQRTCIRSLTASVGQECRQASPAPSCLSSPTIRLLVKAGGSERSLQKGSASSLPQAVGSICPARVVRLQASVLTGYYIPKRQAARRVHTQGESTTRGLDYLECKFLRQLVKGAWEKQPPTSHLVIQNPLSALFPSLLSYHYLTLHCLCICPLIYYLSSTTRLLVP